MSSQHCLVRYLSICALVLAACAEDPGATVCKTGIICPTGMTCAAAQPVCIVNNCGNGVVDVSSGEACDDGNIIIGDGCSPNCTLESCGDGVVVSGERCDDGNNDSGDGCSKDCLSIETCGNLIKDVTEVCDDGNEVSGDGCSANCKSAEVCGNGIKDVNEACDDGNTVGGDACTPDCQAAAGCGNGVIDVDMMGVPVEECDDGNPTDGDDCLNNCKRAVCGDGVEASTATGGFFEECDGGTVGGSTPNETPTCNIDCTDIDCGDGKVNQSAGEQCDNGTANDSATCDMDNCTVPVCGDGHLNTAASEVCDPGAVGADTSMCDSDCTMPSCGDDHVNHNFTPSGGSVPEGCDDGGTTGGDGCSAVCQIESCGNGVTEMSNGEQCDDMNAVDTDACRNNCRLPACGDGIKSASETCDTNGNSQTCDANCSVPQCGDGFLNTAFTPSGQSNPENCDDNNTTNGDGCSSVCRIESCGNGVTDGANGEQCDDMNADDLDGCRNNCQLPACGDGVKSNSEPCDTNGNSQTCNFNCTAPACGDGIMNPAFTPGGGSQPENCDDTNTMSGDGCSGLCRLEPFTLNTLKNGTGAGTVTSTPGGINCGSDCIEVYPVNTMVQLMAMAAAKSRFTGWSGGGCTGTGTCNVMMDAAKSVTAGFEALRLTVTKSGAGSGTVNGPNITCGGDCTEDYDLNTVVTLTQTPSSDSVFLGWTGDCTGMGTCMVTMSQARNVNAQFGLNTFTLTVTPAGTGTGQVTTATPGIDCPGDCSEPYIANTAVTLIADPATTSTFTGWSGTGINCPGTGNCTVTMDQARTVTATFTIKKFNLTVTSPGNNGTITAAGGLINCGQGNTDCSEMNVNAGTAITLTAAPANKKAFSTWGGACAGQPGTTCNLTMDSDKTVSATFVDNKLTVVREGDGNGTVTAATGNINCGNKCSDDYTFGAMVTLTASPASGSRFGGWSEPEAPAGNCGTNASCQVQVNGPRTVTATFIDLDDVSVNFTGAGGGGIVWTPTAAACTDDCTRTFDDGTNVAIAATEDASSIFVSWAGCTSTSGTGGRTCNITGLSLNTNVTLTFAIARTLNMTIAGDGTVTATGINCTTGTTGDCTETYADGTVVILTAAPTGAGAFTGWTGGSGTCTAMTSPCTMTMDAAKNVTATFNP